MASFKGVNFSQRFQELLSHPLGSIGFVFFDEIDKMIIDKKNILTPHSRNASERATVLQRELLIPLDKDGVIQQDNHGLFSENSKGETDSSGMFFILTGAFTDYRKETGKTEISIKNLEEEGFFSREFLGRVQHMFNLKEISEDVFVKVAKAEEDNVPHYKDILKNEYHLKVTFSDEAIRALARISVASEMGVRAITAKMEQVLQYLMKIEGKKPVKSTVDTDFEITAATVRDAVGAT